MSRGGTYYASSKQIFFLIKGADLPWGYGKDLLFKLNQELIILSFNSGHSLSATPIPHLS